MRGRKQTLRGFEIMMKETAPRPEEPMKLADHTRWPVVLITVAGGIVAALHVGKISPGTSSNTEQSGPGPRARRFRRLHVLCPGHGAGAGRRSDGRSSGAARPDRGRVSVHGA